MSGAELRGLDQVSTDGRSSLIERAIAVERPCAIEVNGLGYAVMMVTPTDLEDFAYGFALSERLIDRADDLQAVDEHARQEGVLLRLTTAPALRSRVADRVRHRISDSSCGMCGIENLEQALRPLPRLPGGAPVEPGAIFAGLSSLRDHQPLNRATGAVHCAAACDMAGKIRIVREDVGRHNAFDKLIGAMLRGGMTWDEGFALLSSRCSYELVEKAALSGCSTLVTVSAATTLALSRAKEAGIELISLARLDSFLREFA